MSELRRGLGRGLSALLGDPVGIQPTQRSTPAAWIPPSSPVAMNDPVVVDMPAPTAPPVAPPSLTVVPPPVGEGTPPDSTSFVTANPEPAIAPDGGQGPKATAIDLILRNPNQPRRHFAEAELNELADSIRAHGVLQPILVRPLSGGKYEIVAGERRWRAAQLAGLTEIPALVRDLDDVEILEIAIVENVQRADLNAIEEAQGYQALIDRFGRTQQEIADAIGKSRPHIANTLRLLALPAEVLEMVRDGRLTAGHARAILTAPDPVALALRAVAEGLNVREVERLAAEAKDAKYGARVMPSRPDKDPDTRDLETRLSSALGFAVSITPKGEGVGEVRIAYKNLEQLDEIARRLS